MDIIITGATGGIGSCLVRQLCSYKKANRIYCIFRNANKFNAIYPKLNKKMVIKKRTMFPQKDIEHLIADLNADASSDISCVFSAFSISPIKRIGSFSRKELQDNLTINLMDLVMLTNALIKYKIETGSKLKLINFDSGAAYRALEGWSLYSASKAYVNMFLKTVQLENPDIQVVSYEPGVVDTAMQEEIRRTKREIFNDVDTFKEYFNNGDLRNPEDIAEDIIKRFILEWDTDSFSAGYK